MRTIKCDQPGCNFVAHHDTDYVNCIIGRHKAMRHGIRKGKYIKVADRKPGNSPVEAPPVVESISVPNYCPNCGCSMRAVTAAMNLRRKG